MLVPGQPAGKRLQTPSRTGPPQSISKTGSLYPHRETVPHSAMYNVFVDKDVLATIRDVAGRLASSAASPSEWASTELGGLVRFTDDRSQDRVRKILSAYTDGSLQEKGVSARVTKERSTMLDSFLPKREKGTLVSRSMGLASYRLAETSGADNDMRRQCTNEPGLFPTPSALPSRVVPRRQSIDNP